MPDSFRLWAVQRCWVARRLINEAMVRQYLPRQNPYRPAHPLGTRNRSAKVDDHRSAVADVKQYSLAPPAYPAVFRPFMQSNESWRRWMPVVVRVPNSSASLIPEIRRQI